MVKAATRQRLLGMDTGLSIGRMGLIMRASGRSIRRRVKALFGMQKETSIVVSSSAIWPMAKESILILTALNILENLEMMSKKAMAKKNGLMAQSMSVIMGTV